MKAKGEGSDEAEVNTTTEFSDQERESEDSNIEHQKEQEPCHSLKQRQLNLLADGVKRAVEDIDNQEELAQKRVLEETRQRWISLGMMREEDAPFTPVSERPLPSKHREFKGRILCKEKRRRRRDAREESTRALQQ